MSVLQVSTTDAGEVRTDSAGVSTIIDQYRATMSHVDDGEVELRIGLPGLQRWQPHPRSPGFYVTDFEAIQEQWLPNWRIRVQYSNSPLVNPLEIPAKIRGRSYSLSGSTLVDHEGRLMLNTAGDPFEPQEKRETVWVFDIRKNVADIPDWLLEYPEAINLDVVKIGSRTCPPRTVALAGMQFDDIDFLNDVRFRPLALELHYRKTGWETFVPSRGFQERYQAPAPFVSGNFLAGEMIWKKRKIVTDDGSYPNEPQMLDAEGRWIKEPNPQDVVILKFQIPQALPFSRLPLK